MQSEYVRGYVLHGAALYLLSIYRLRSLAGAGGVTLPAIVQAPRREPGSSGPLSSAEMHPFD